MALSEAEELELLELEEQEAQLGGGQSAPTPTMSTTNGQAGPMDTLMQAAKQGGQTALAALNPVQTLKQAPDIANRVMNFQQGQPNTPATGILEAAANRPDVTATVAAGLIPGTAPLSMAARIGGTAGAAALAPENRGMNALGAGGLQALFEGVFPLAGKFTNIIGEKALAPIGQALSNVDKKEIIKLAKKPLDILLAPSKKAMGEKFEDVYRAFGFTEPEIRLIAKAESKAGNGSMQVWDDTMAKLSKGEELSIAELVAARRASSKLGYSTKEGMLGTQFKKDVKLIEQKLEEKAPEIAPRYLGLLKEYSKTMTRNKFLQLLPQNKNGSVNALRSLIAVGGTAINPATLAVMSPLTTGLATLGVVGASKAVGAAARSRTGQSGLQAIRQYLMGQQQNGPGSR